MWYFDDARKVGLLKLSLEKWAGTPFAQGCAIVGAGVDCVCLVREVLRDCGVDVSPAEEIPAYSLAWGVHHRHSPLLGWLHESVDVRRVLRRIDPDAPWMPGDIAAVRVSLGAHHMVIAGAEAEPRIWHVPVPGVVCSVERGDWWDLRAVVRMRLIREDN